MLPAREYSLARWKNTSTSWSSSRIATLVSWRFAAITNSLLMDTPTVHGENRSFRERGTDTVGPCASGDPEGPFVQHTDLKIFRSDSSQPHKVENQISKHLISQQLGFEPPPV